MARHLVEVIGIDVNAETHDFTSSHITPLCYVWIHRTGQDFRELIWFLVDHGARWDGVGPYGDLEPRIGSKMQRNTPFLDAMKEWQEDQVSRLSRDRRYMEPWLSAQHV